MLVKFPGEGNVRQGTTNDTYWRLLRYEWRDPSLIGSLMMISPFRILILYKQVGFVHTQALYSIEAPWLPKSESGTRSPSLHLRHRGNAFSTKSPPSFSREDCIRLPYHGFQARLGDKDSRGGASATASASPQQYYIGLRHGYHTTKSFLCQHNLEDSFIINIQ